MRFDGLGFSFPSSSLVSSSFASSLHAEKFLDAVRWFGLLVSKFVFSLLFFCLFSLSLCLFALNLHFFLTLFLLSVNIFFSLLFLLVGHQVSLDGHQLLHQGLLLRCSF